MFYSKLGSKPLGIVFVPDIIANFGNGTMSRDTASNEIRFKVQALVYLQYTPHYLLRDGDKKVNNKTLDMHGSPPDANSFKYSRCRRSDMRVTQDNCWLLATFSL